MKICLMAAKLLHGDEQTDMTKLIVTFGNFANAPKIWAMYTELIAGTHMLPSVELSRKL